MTTLPNTGIVLPTRGPSGAGVWNDALDAALQIIDALDHTTGKGLPIPTAGLNINADLSFSSLYAPKNLHRLQFSEIAGGSLVGANNLSLFVSDGTGGLTAHELYFRTSAGNNIKFTSGSALNVGAFVGGIGGDYTSVSALLSYDDANKQYKHLVGGGTNWAHGSFGGIRLLEFNTSETVYVEQLCPAALASSYSMTWPVALPGSTQAVQVDNAGAISFSNTFTSGATIGAQFLISAAITPATIADSLTHDNYNPTGLATANVIRQAINGAPFLSGLAGGTDGRVLIITTTGALSSDNLGLLHENAGSTAGNRFSLPGASTLTFPLNGAVILTYDGGTSRWRVIGKNF